MKASFALPLKNRVQRVTLIVGQPRKQVFGTVRRLCAKLGDRIKSGVERSSGTRISG
jgi:hypothetical protein